MDSVLLRSVKNDEEKEFLQLLLNYLISQGRFFIEIKPDSTYSNSIIFSTLDFMEKEQNSGDILHIPQDSINIIADNYLLKYPNSTYNEFVKNHIRYKFKLSDWAIGSQFFTGGILFTNSLSKYFGNAFVVGLGIEFNYKRFLTYMQIVKGFGLLNNDIHAEMDVWKRKSITSIFTPEITMGYFAIDNLNFRLAGTSGIASTVLGPTSMETELNPDLEKFELGYSLTYTFGVFVDIKMNTVFRDRISFLRIRYNYNIPQFPNDFKGNFHNITIGYGLLGRAPIRVYI
jgi:hypothetical protein